MFVSYECLCCQAEVSATGRSLVQRSPTDCGVCVSVWSSANKQPRHLLSVGRRGKDYETQRYMCIKMTFVPHKEHSVLPLERLVG
jgi:hypothetical protein